MKQISWITGFLFHTIMIQAQLIEEYKIHSDFVKDDYIIIIQKPVSYQSDSAYNLLVVADGRWHLGNAIFGTDKEKSALLSGNSIIVAIAHTGDVQPRRNRDFIPAKKGSAMYGHAQQFYFFLKEELLPFIHKQFPLIKNKAFIGHSLSGLFCMYLLFQNDKLFDTFFAISPSVWANGFILSDIEKEYTRQHRDLAADVVIFNGAKEIFNLIRFSNAKLVNALKGRNYPSLHLKYTLIKGANHFSILQPAIKKIMDDW